MNEQTAQRLETAERALESADTSTAAAELRAVLDETNLADAHRMLAMVHYFEDRLDDARREFEAAYGGYRREGQPCAAARVAIAIAALHYSSLGNRSVGQGWLGRAKRLLDRVGPCVDWGYLELAFVACDRPDVDELEQSAERALRIAAEFGDTELEVRALADSGLALVSQGRTTDGFARLDEAMTAIIAGEVRDPAVAGLSFCAMLSSCERSGDVRRAEEWLRVVAERMLEPSNGRPRVLHTHCRLAYGAVLTSAGRWPEAEAAMLEALGPHSSRSLVHRVQACARLAELRVHQGRVEEAMQLLEPYEDTLAACTPLARIYLQRGAPDLAAAAARRGLRELRGDVTRAGPLLALLVEAELACVEIDAADRAAQQLAAMTVGSESAVLHAEAALAAARVHHARGDHGAAALGLEEAQRHLGGEACPLLSGVVRHELAQVYAAAGNTAASIGEARAALALFDRLGATIHADRTSALLRRLGAPTKTRAHTAAARLRGLTARETEVLGLLCEGLTNGEIAARLFISAKTAEHHVGRILTKLGVRTRAEAAAVSAAVSAAQK